MAKDDNDLLFEQIVIRQLQGLRIDAQQRREIRQRLRELQAGLVAAISDIAPTEVGGQRRQQARLEKLLKEAQARITEAFTGIEGAQKVEMRLYAQIEAEAMQEFAQSLGLSAVAIGKRDLNAAIDAILIEGAPSAEWWRRQDQQLRRKFTDEMRQAVLQGESVQKMVQRVRGTRALQFTDGIMHTTTRNAEALVRTSVQRVGNEARKQFWEENQNLISAYEHVSVLDSRTSEICAVRDGKLWDAATKKPIGHSLPFDTPPVHWNCRSSLIPVLKGVKKADEALRASIDGPVRATTTFEDFLSDKPEKFQDEVLGKGKARLWREGKISFSDLLNQSGNPLTLEQLKLKANR